jgi:hypothetical protein
MNPAGCKPKQHKTQSLFPGASSRIVNLGIELLEADKKLDFQLDAGPFSHRDLEFQRAG